MLLLPADTPKANFSHVLVYTGSDLVEQTTPAYLSLVDLVGRAANLSFADQDLDLNQIGGLLSWDPPSNIGAVTDYSIYVAEDMLGSNRSYVGNTAVGVNQLLIPADTQVPFQVAYLLVFATSRLQEQTTPAALAVFDRSSSVSQLAFTDYDLDSGEIGGNVSWTEPVDQEEVEARRAESHFKSF